MNDDELERRLSHIEQMLSSLLEIKSSPNIVICSQCGATAQEIAKANAMTGSAEFCIPCGCDAHGDHLACAYECGDYGCNQAIGTEVICDHSFTRDTYAVNRFSSKTKPLTPQERDELHRAVKNNDVPKIKYSHPM